MTEKPKILKILPVSELPQEQKETLTREVERVKQIKSGERKQ